MYGPQAPCPGLVWDEEQGRHWCKLVREAAEERREAIKDGLAIGDGCSSSMVNTWRQELRCRTRE